MVSEFDSRIFSLNITARVDLTAFLADEVETAVRLALLDNFKLKNRKLGENLYLSEVYKIVEQTAGVENSICVLDDDPARQVVPAVSKRTVIHLGKLSEARVTVNVERAEP
jgi:uncharacterized phage protein gp47/JayE